MIRFYMCSKLRDSSNSKLSWVPPAAAARHAMMAQMHKQAHRLHDPQLHGALLLNSSVAKDQRVWASLLQTSKQLHAAVAQLLCGQLQAVLSTAKAQQAEALVCWLRKHARLLQGLDLQLISSIRHGGTLDWSEFTATMLAAALQEAAASGALAGLHSLALRGTTAGPSFLQALPAAQLTKLTVEVCDHDTSAITALATCTALRSLRLRLCQLASGNPGSSQMTAAELAAARSAVLQPLAAGLQQLTELRIGRVTVAQLQQLPSKLQQLHVIVDLKGDTEQLQQLAGWMQQHAIIVSSLQLVGLQHMWLYQPTDWEQGMDAFGQTFSVAPVAAAEETGHPPHANSCKGPQLQSLVMSTCYDGCAAAPALLQQLPACRLTQLQCLAASNSAAQLAAVSRLTAMRRLNLRGSSFQLAYGNSSSALTPLTALQQLTALQLPSLHPPQLAGLQLPQLQQLHIGIANSAQTPPLQVAHLTSLHTLRVEDYSKCGLGGGTQLPPLLRELSWERRIFIERCNGCTQHGCSVQALLSLTRLQKLYLTFCAHAPSAPKLAQLSSLSSLQEVGLSYCRVPCTVLAASAADAWPLLPLVCLDLPAAVLAPCLLEQLTVHAGALNHLTRLHCKQYRSAAPSELSAVLQQLPALQSLELHADPVEDSLSGLLPSMSQSPDGADIIKAHGMEAVVELLRALGSLHELSTLGVRMAVHLTADEAQQVTGQLQQLLGRQLSGCCTVTEDQLSIRRFVHLS